LIIFTVRLPPPYLPHTDRFSSPTTFFLHPGV
jgi:hypothetical protein